MSTQIFISILLAIVGFIGALGVKQLISIAKSVNNIQVDIGIIITRQQYMEEKITKLESKKK